jgi:RNA polymerase sigma factor (TIGR02999 family)
MFDRPSASADDHDSKPQADEISKMLKAWSEGDVEAADRFMPLIYDDLRRQAHRYLNRERPNHTLQTTALVHEAYIRLLEQKGVSWQNRSHFIGLAAKMMRRILVNYAVSRNRNKRGGGAEKVELADTLHVEADANRVDLIQGAA